MLQAEDRHSFGKFFVQPMGQLVRSAEGQMFLQGIAGTLELFHLSLVSFQSAVGEASGHPVAVYQRIDQAGYKLPIDERVLADTDTLMVFEANSHGEAIRMLCRDYERLVKPRRLRFAF